MFDQFFPPLNRSKFFLYHFFLHFCIIFFVILHNNSCIFLRFPRCTLKFHSIQKSLQRLKNGVLPRNPSTVSETKEAFENAEVLKTFGFTFNDNQPFYDGAVETKDYSFCIFSSKITIKLIKENIPSDGKHILMDATFKTCPQGPFNQLLIIYIRKHHEVCFGSLSINIYIYNSFHSIFFFHCKKKEASVYCKFV